MKFLRSLLLPLSVLTSPWASENSYRISENIVGQDFYNSFNWFTGDDPTHGRVNYVDMQTSINQGLTSANGNSFVLRTDHSTVLDPNGPGRNSVRIQSQNAYGNHVVIFDLRHMPQGCGTWPAIWELGQGQWPYGGEIDIVEGVNDQGPNLAALHTSDGCTMPAERWETGTSRLSNCNTLIHHNAGCSVSFPSANSYGPSFNNNGGGWYVMERSDAAIKMWFWSRHDSSVPTDVKSGSNSVNPQNWGKPTANYPSDSCDFNSRFTDSNIIINLTLCGSWAGNAYGGSGCPSKSCVDFVNNNPGNFSDAYFDFAAVRIYT